MIIDWPATAPPGAKTYLTVSRPVLQRLIDGRTQGLALRPLGALTATFHASESTTPSPRLLFTLTP